MENQISSNDEPLRVAGREGIVSPLADDPTPYGELVASPFYEAIEKKDAAMRAELHQALGGVATEPSQADALPETVTNSKKIAVPPSTNKPSMWRAAVNLVSSIFNR